MGRIVCELDPEKAAKRDASLTAARASGQRGPGQNIGGQVAPLTAGLTRADDPAAGWLFPQPFVRRGDRTGRMDELTGCGFRLFVDNPQLLPDAARLQAAGILSVVLNAEGEHAVTEIAPPSAIAWLAERGVHAALVRPDHYVFGGARDARETAVLVDAATAMLRG
jgi:3-(3-hydroxy-phenyl)propionate hydroxylase